MGDTDPSTLAPAPSVESLREARDAAVDWSAARLGVTDPFTLVLLVAIERRYELTALAAASAARSRALDDLGPTAERRLLDSDARVDPTVFADPDAYVPGLLVAGALACDDPGSPRSFEQWLRDAIASGGYDLTHAAVALGIEAELGCEPTGGEALRTEIVAALEDAVREDRAVDDLAIERIAMLAYLGRLDLVPTARTSALLAAQRPDGSYTTSEQGFEPHTTALAIWVLSAVLEREEGRPDLGPPLLLAS